MSLTDKNYCTLYIARHGETEWNLVHITQGHHDSPLTEKGVEQARQTAEELKEVNFEAVFSSDLYRAERTAEIIKLERDLAVQTHQALRERCSGSWEGKDGTEFTEKFNDILEKLKALPEGEQWRHKLAPDIESHEELIGRFITKLREIAVAYAGKNVLVVSHGGPIRFLLMHLGYAKLGSLPANSFSNAGYIKVWCDGIDFEVKEVKGIRKP